jgi:hypothetical protein
LGRLLNGESDGKEDVEAPIMRDPVPEWERRILCTVGHPCTTQKYPRERKTHENQSSLSSGGLQARGQRLGLPGPRFCRVLDPVKSKPCGEGDPSTIWATQRKPNRGNDQNPETPEGETAKGAQKGMWTHQRMSGVGCKRGHWEDESWPITSSGWPWGQSESGSHQD